MKWNDEEGEFLKEENGDNGDAEVRAKKENGD